MVFVLLSPAKTMAFDRPRPQLVGAAPHFQKNAVAVAAAMRGLSAAQLAKLLAISPKLAALNKQRFDDFAAKPSASVTDAAILAYQGDTYLGFHAKSADDDDLLWAHDHIGILSGLYGVVQPLDAIQPYRLEMGTVLAVDSHKNLYAYWGTMITARINGLVAHHKLAVVVGCASNEYLDAVQTENLSVPFVQCDFKEHKNGTLKTVGLFAKRARGAMARYVVDHRVTDVAAIKKFDTFGYAFDPALSTPQQFVFVR